MGQLAVFTPLLGLHFYLLPGRGPGFGSTTGRTAEAVVAQSYGHVPRAITGLGALLVNPRRCIVGDGDSNVGTLLLTQTPKPIVLTALFRAVSIGQTRDLARWRGGLLLRAWLVALPGVIGPGQLARRRPVIVLLPKIPLRLQQTAT